MIVPCFLLLLLLCNTLTHFVIMSRVSSYDEASAVYLALVVGAWEVLPHLPRLRRRLHEAVAAVHAAAPDALITIDSKAGAYTRPLLSSN